VAQVAVLRSGPQIDPLADVTVAQKAVVILVAVAMNDARLDLTPDPAVGTERGAGTELGAEHVRLRPDITRALQPGEGPNHGFAIDHHGAFRRVGDDQRIK